MNISIKPKFAQATMDTNQFCKDLKKNLQLQTAVTKNLKITYINPPDITHDHLKNLIYEFTDWKTLLEHIHTTQTITFTAHLTETTSDEPQYEDETTNPSEIELTKIPPKQAYIMIKNDLIDIPTHNAIQHFKNNIIQPTNEDTKWTDLKLKNS